MEVSMAHAGRADVIVAINRVTPSTLPCLRRVLEIGDAALHRLIVVTGPCPDPSLENFGQSSSNISLVRQSDDSIHVESWNRGLRERSGDAVLLAPDTSVTAGWLTELSAVAHGEERIAFVWPLMNLDDSLARSAFSGLPRSTTAPGVLGPCVYLRGCFIDTVGLLDASLSTLQSAMEDWAMRAQAVGYFGKRANHAIVEQSVSGPGAAADRSLTERDQTVLEKRHPYRSHQVADFAQSLDGSLPLHVIDFFRTGRVRVAFDLRHLVPDDDSERTDALTLANALAEFPEIDLSVLVNEPRQSAGFTGRLITPDDWHDDFAVIHKPAPFRSREELAIPFSSSAHVIVTYDGVAPERAPGRNSRGGHDGADRTTHSLSLPCAQGILAPSQLSRQRIAFELGIPSTEITVAPHAAAPDAVFRVYRSAVLNPPERSLRARRMLREAILSWSSPSGRPLRFDPPHAASDRSTIGVRQAWQALADALKRRVGRELRRLRVSRARNRD
jgi:hypothetical protein